MIMKKNLKITLVSFLFLGLTYTGFSQAVSRFNFITDAYYGYPYMKAGWRAASNNVDGVMNLKRSIVGPMGVRTELMLGDHFGIGIDGIYAGFDERYDKVLKNDTVASNIRINMQHLRIHGRFNFHFLNDVDRVDSYFGLGIGSNLQEWEYYKNGERIDPDELDNNFFEDIFFRNPTGAFFPMSMRACIGVRFYFNQVFGLSAEIGVGGPLLSTGLSVKF